MHTGRQTPGHQAVHRLPAPLRVRQGDRGEGGAQVGGDLLAVVETDHRPGRTYRLTVVTTGTRIRVFLDGGATPVIDVLDGTYAGSRGSGFSPGAAP